MCLGVRLQTSRYAKPVKTENKNISRVRYRDGWSKRVFIKWSSSSRVRYFCSAFGREHLERNDFIIEKQKAELQRIDAVKRHTKKQANLAEHELGQVKSEIRTDKLKKATTNAATAIASGVDFLFGSGKLKELERTNEKLQNEVLKRNMNIKNLQSQIQQMQKQHDTQMHNLREMHRQDLDIKEKEISRLSNIIDRAFRWFPMFREMLRMEKLCAMLGFSKEMTERLVVKKEALKCSGKIYSEQNRRNFDIKDDALRVENDPDDESRLSLTVNREPIATGSGSNGTDLDMVIGKQLMSREKAEDTDYKNVSTCNK